MQQGIKINRVLNKICKLGKQKFLISNFNVCVWGGFLAYFPGIEVCI